MKRPKHPPHADISQLAKSIVDHTTDSKDDEPESAAVKRGRLGGAKGGAARAKKLSSDKRSEIAKKAAAARWLKTTG